MNTTLSSYIPKGRVWHPCSSGKAAHSQNVMLQNMASSSVQCYLCLHCIILPWFMVLSPLRPFLLALDKRQLWLLYFPFFPPQVSTREKTSADYLAPEQIRGECSPSSDLYSLAATLHHAVTGYGPQQRLAFFYPPARRLNPAVTPQMEAILAHALRLSASQRFTGSSQMQQELSNLIASSPSISTISISDPIPLAIGKVQIRQRSHRESFPNFGIVGGLSTAIILFLSHSLCIRCSWAISPLQLLRQHNKPFIKRLSTKN